MSTSAIIERASPADLTELAGDVGPAPMHVAAILLLDAEPPTGSATTIADQIRAVPRLRQLLVHTPPGCGRPVWIDDPAFDIRRHVDHHICPQPADNHALLQLAARIAVRRLPTNRPLWSATLVTGLTHGRAALIVVLHHVLADGIGGLAILTSLVDGAPRAPADITFPRPAPSRRQLLADAFAERIRTLATLPAALKRLRAAATELRPAGTDRPARHSLNRPTGPRRHLAIAHADLAALRDAAHTHGGTVNDAILTAVAGALRATLRRRGEDADSFVISIPVAARRTATATRLGNQVGVRPVQVPATGDPLARLRRVARATRARTGAPRGASAALLGPAFRTLARLGLFGWFINRQRLITTFVTNLRGPDTRLNLFGAHITEVYPVAVVPGNVTVAFAALSYAGNLAITVVADPDTCPDLPLVARHLQDELDALTGTPPAN